MKIKSIIVYITIVILIYFCIFLIAKNHSEYPQFRRYSAYEDLKTEYFFNLDSQTNEFAWRDNLTEKLGGKKEASIKFGRVDVETDKYAIEVEFIHKWHEGIGQAIHYAYETNKRGVIAIISTSKSDKEKINYVRKICKKNKIEIFILKNY